MDPTVVVIMFFALGVLILIAEIFVPSHGVLTLAGVGFMVFAIYRAYQDLGSTAGHIAILATLVLLPTLALVAVKTFHRTPWGRKIAPPNPTVRVEEFAPQYGQLRNYMGHTGKTLTPLRPVGTCLLNGDRIDCVAETGMIERDVSIRVVGIRGHELEVSPVKES